MYYLLLKQISIFEKLSTLRYVYMYCRSFTLSHSSDNSNYQLVELLEVTRKRIRKLRYIHPMILQKNVKIPTNVRTLLWQPLKQICSWLYKVSL